MPTTVTAAGMRGAAPARTGRWARWVATQRSRVAGLPDLPARLAWRAANVAPVRRLLAKRHRAAVERHRPALPVSAGIDADIVAALRRDGVFVTSLATLALPGAEPVIAAAAALADAFGAEAHRRVRAGSEFNVVPAAALVAQPAIFRLGLADRLLTIAEAYLEVPVAYDGVSLNYTVADGREVSTRKWHRDWEDRRMLKVAIYLNDVDEGGGPFQMVRRTDADLREAQGYRYDLATDEEMEAVLGDDFRRDIVSCVGPAGTVVFTDTARFFHRGKPATERDRKALFYSYFARRPRHPFYCERSGLSRRDIATLSRGLAPAQVAAVEWRRRLPLFLRLIPPARV